MCDILLPRPTPTPIIKNSGIHNLNLDLMELEAFAARSGVKGLEESFSELRQLLNLFLSGDVTAILDEHTRALRYNHLSTQKLLKFMDRYKDIGLFTSLPPNIRKLKKSVVEMVAKRLT